MFRILCALRGADVFRDACSGLSRQGDQAILGSMATLGNGDVLRLLTGSKREWDPTGRGVPAVSQTKSVRIQDHFAELTDPRRRKVTYGLVNVV